MKTSKKVPVLLAGIILLCTCMPGCNHYPGPETKHIQQQPNYSRFSFKLGDTLSFPLTEHTYNNIAASSYFISNGVPYLCFYDKGSKSILIYNFETRQPLKIIPLVKWVKKSKLDKANVRFINFDTIFVTTQQSVFIFDSTGNPLKKVDFFDQRGKTGTVNNSEPPVLQGEYYYIGVKPNVSEKSLSAHRKWRGLYKINIQTGEKEMIYPLPPIYHSNLYGYPYLDYSYCINNKGNFVFSFAADSNVYETDLGTFQNSYNASSKFHKGPIPFMTMKDLENPDSYQTYALRDSYGSLVFDPYRKQYYRQAKQGATPEQVKAKLYGKKRSLIIMDENFRIIGEEVYEGDFSFSSLFFDHEGMAYVRINYKDESALHFAKINFENEHHRLALSR